jgi:hypothetical protein
MLRLADHSSVPTGQPGTEIGRPRIRIINGRAYVMVDEAMAARGKYREDKPHYEWHDARVWVLIEDIERLSTGNRLKA